MKDLSPCQVAETSVPEKHPPLHRLLPTLKCEVTPHFRSLITRDCACLLDLDPTVERWSTRPTPLVVADVAHIADFTVRDTSGETSLFDCFDRRLNGKTDAIRTAAREQGLRYRTVTRPEIYDGFRLQNARDLLRYATFRVSLSERVRLLATLDDQGSLTLAECMTVISGNYGVAAVGALILQGFIEVDLDAAVLGPETIVRRISR